MKWSCVFTVVAYLTVCMLASTASDSVSATSIVYSTADISNVPSTLTVAPQTVNTGPSHHVVLSTDDCNQTKADVGFLLDINSGSGLYDFRTQVNFVKAFVSQLNISSQVIQVGVVTYSNSTHPLFFLNDHGSRRELMDALSNISSSSSLPYHRAQSQHHLSSTHTALDYMRTVFFTPASGARVGVPKVLFLLTDGNSTEPLLARQAAAQIKSTGVHVIAGNLGGSRDEVQLRALASDPSSVLSANPLGAPLDRVENATELFCQAIQPTLQSITTLTTQPPNNCSGTPADLVFIVDTSVSEGPISFHKQIEFVANITSQLDIGPSHNQVGLVTYSTYATNQFYLNSHTTKDSVLKALDQVAFHSGASYTGDALQFVRRNTFTPAHGQRENALPIVVVLTDGQSSDNFQTVREASALKARGALVLAVGIGSDLDTHELDQIATDTAHVFTVTSHHFLSAIENQIVAEIKCGNGGQWVQEVTTPMTTTEPACQDTEAADVLIFLDTSDQGGQGTFDRMINFTKDLINDFTIGDDKIRFSVQAYADMPNSVFWFNSFTNKADMMSAIQTVRTTGGTSNLDEALKFAREYAYAGFHGARPDKPNYVIIVTNGVSENVMDTITQADELKRDGVVVMAVGIGDKVDQKELTAIATRPSHVFLVPQLSKLQNVHEIVHGIICEDINNPFVSATASALTAPADILIG